jgi:hypothetical protein
MDVDKEVHVAGVTRTSSPVTRRRQHTDRREVPLSLFVTGEDLPYK